jgi:hypothetical protein
MVRKKYFVMGPLEQPRKNKNLLNQHDKPNKPTKEGPLSFVILESPFTSVSTVRGHPPLYSSLSFCVYQYWVNKGLSGKNILKEVVEDWTKLIFFFGGGGGDFFVFLFVHYSALLHLPPLRFHCADGSNPGPLQLVHWQSDALTTRLDLIKIDVKER